MNELLQENEFIPIMHDDPIKSIRKSYVSSNTTDTCRDLGFVDNLIDSNRFSSDEDAPRKRTLKRVKRFSDSDSDSSKTETQNDETPASKNTSEAVKSVLQSDDSDSNITKSVPHKARILNNFSDSAESEGEEEVENHHVYHRKKYKLQHSKEASPTENDNKIKSGSESDNAIKNEEQQLRMKNKKNKLKDKFKGLLKTRGKESSLKNESENNDSNNLSESDEELASIEKIKQLIKERISFKSSVCDPDTSDEDINQQKSIYKQKKERKIKLTSPKPQRMSAKQAMENMQKIKSESNRMLREKEVSLPYHRPKALSLKDIMSRRKLAVSSDGKALPIKMNKDQLKQYAQMLEERQKEMMILCKSESEEDEINENPAEFENGTEEVVKNSDENFVVDMKKPAENFTAVKKDSTDNGICCVKSLEKVSTEISIEIQAYNVSSNPLNYSNEQNSNENTENDTSADQNIEQNLEEQDSETSMKLVYNNSANSFIEENLTTDLKNQVDALGTENNIYAKCNSNSVEQNSSECKTVQNHEDNMKNNTERDSQLISLHLETASTDFSNKDITFKESTDNPVAKNYTRSVDQVTKDDSIEDNEISVVNNGTEVENEFSDDDINMADIDSIIENAEIIKDIEDKMNSQFLIRDKPLNINPKLTGSPGMVIDLEDSDTAPRKSGVELLKERFTYFSKLKTPEEIKREREKKIKPGTQLKKLKQELEEEIAEQRSLEWAKRLEEEKQQQKELKELRGEDSEEDDIDKIEAAIDEKEGIKEASENSDSGEEEPIENDVEIKDKPRSKNAMLDDEAEESDCDDNEDKEGNKIEKNYYSDDGIEGDDDGVESINDELESNDSDESSESEEEQTVTKKGRILKAFEDSDEEDAVAKEQPVAQISETKGTSESSGIGIFVASQISSQDEELQLAQRPKSTLDDLFTSQDSVLLTSEAKEQAKDNTESDDLFTQTQTFSILDSTKPQTADLDLNSSGKTIDVDATQSLDINNIDDIALCPVTDSQNLPLPSQILTTQLSQSQPIGEDILALCTGQFYNNQFVSQIDNQALGGSENYDAYDNLLSQDNQNDDVLETPEIFNRNIEKESPTDTEPINPKSTENFVELNSTEKYNSNKITKESSIDLKETENFVELSNTKDKDNTKDKVIDDNLKSILDELADPDFDAPKSDKFFDGSNSKRDSVHTEIQMKRKLVIDSDDETNEGDNEPKKLKKLKKKKPEKRALQISDDEEEQSETEEIEEYESDIEEDNTDRLVEYDSEENEIEVKPQNPKKKRKMGEFFENEAELTSEDEWVGSGDEDEAGLDRMEREDGDDDIFHQGALQRELGQIHMRDVLDQDKREVRIIQELLFEDGDLGGGGRQRKFRWNDMGDEETGTVPDEFADTQEEEFESEEQWRKQRHEREMFLRQLQNKEDPNEKLNVSLNRTTIIKANLLSKTMSSLLMEVNNSTSDKTESPAVEKKTSKDIPSPKKPFALVQQSYQGSFLSRGRGALARLAALATPLANDDDAKVGTIGPNSRRNFVFAALTPEEKVPKVTKRKAESNATTPKLVKKIRTEEKNTSKNSLLDHFKL